MKGFGYDSVSDDYKVVTISCIDQLYGNVYVYSLTTNTWKQATHLPYYNINIQSWSGVFVSNGFLHWIVYSHSKPVIVAFSLADEKLSELSPPNEVDIESQLHTNLVALGEKQLAIYNEAKGDVWLMNEYGVHTSWTKIICGFIQIPMYNPIVFGNNWKVLFLTGDLLWIYDVEERTFSVHVSYMKIRYFFGACAESLVSPKFSTPKSKSSNSMEDNCEDKFASNNLFNVNSSWGHCHVFCFSL
nr:hypothetical protein [Tanacetum cinerariifolium]